MKESHVYDRSSMSTEDFSKLEEAHPIACTLFHIDTRASGVDIRYLNAVSDFMCKKLCDGLTYMDHFVSVVFRGKPLRIRVLQHLVTNYSKEIPCHVTSLDNRHEIIHDIYERTQLDYNRDEFDFCNRQNSPSVFFEWRGSVYLTTIGQVRAMDFVFKHGIYAFALKHKEEIIADQARKTQKNIADREEYKRKYGRKRPRQELTQVQHSSFMVFDKTDLTSPTPAWHDKKQRPSAKNLQVILYGERFVQYVEQMKAARQRRQKKKSQAREAHENTHSLANQDGEAENSESESEGYSVYEEDEEEGYLNPKELQISDICAIETGSEVDPCDSMSFLNKNDGLLIPSGVCK